MDDKDYKIKSLIQTNRTYKGMLQKQNKIIDAMAEEFVSKTLMHSDKTKQEVREYFERKIKSGKD